MQKKTPEKENKEKPLPAADSAVPNRQRHAGSSDEPAPNGAGAEAKTAPDAHREPPTAAEKTAAAAEQTADDGNIQSVFDHSGHRKRMRDYYRRNGMDRLRDYEILELVLFYAIPRKDTRVIARRLLNKFGSLSRVLDAPMEELTSVQDISENAGTLLKMIPELARHYAIDKKQERPVLDTPEKMIEYLSDFFIGRTVECFYLLCLDHAGRLLRCTEMAQGEPNQVTVNLKKIGMEISFAQAPSLVIAHNHPQGLPLPSPKDIELTEKIAALARNMNSVLFDHLIFSDSEVFSMASSGRFYSKIFGYQE